MSKILKFAEYDIEALIDNELDQEQYHKTLEKLANNPKARRKYKALFRQKMLLKKWWQEKEKA